MEPVHPPNSQPEANDTLPTQKIAGQRKSPRVLFGFFLCTIFVGIFALWHLTTPPPHRGEVIVDIREGSTVSEMGNLLFEKKIIRTPLLFSAFVQYRGVDTKLPSGVFLFDTPRNLFQITEQLAVGDRGIERVRITIPEGYTTAQIATLVSKSLPELDENEFRNITKSKEGYLFPDTYFFFTTATSGEVVGVMQENFKVKTETLFEESFSLNKPWKDIMVMASIIEEEAVTDADRRLVSGILWKRIKIGMRLQVDASFAYIMNKASSEITIDDLNHDSPYNTYRYAGLPPGPIANPGLATISAALYPTESVYLYYLSDKDGVMHYAKTFEEHKLNKARYLR